MQAVILAGGMGTRLRPLTYTVPKPMLPVGGKPAVARTIETLAAAGFDEVIITTNYLADVVAAGLRTLQLPIRVRCVQEAEPLGTAGCVRNILDDLEEEFLIIQGDAVADLRYRALLDFHREHRADVTISVIRVRETREFGIVEVDDDHRILRFQEKPRPEEAFSDLANSGFYFLRREVFKDVPAGVQFDFSRQLFPALMQQGAGLYAFEMHGYWVDIGRVQNYLEGNLHMLRGRSDVGSGVIVPETATLVPPFVVESGTRLGEGCVVGPNTILGEGCVVGSGTHITGSVLFPRVRIGNSARLHDCVVASACRLGDEVVVDPLSVIGEACEIGAGTQVSAHSRVGPVVQVPPKTVVDGVVSPRLEKLEGLQKSMATTSVYGHLTHEQLVICALLAISGEMTARTMAASSEVPFSRIHTVLAPLEEQGLIISTHDVPRRYALTGDEVRLTQ